jgi:AbrB family looped-hinge helix DNA binding protein
VEKEGVFFRLQPKAGYLADYRQQHSQGRLAEEACSLSLSIPYSACHTNPPFREYLLLYYVCISESHTFRQLIPMNDRKLVRIQEKGQVTIPNEIRKKLGLKRGDVVAVMETPEGVFITPQQVLVTKALDRIGDILKEQGVSLEELIVSGRQLR